MLAARHCKDHPGVPVHSLFDGIVRCRVTGMQGDHHVHLLRSLIGTDISMIKMQIPKTILPGKTVTFFDHVFL